MPDKIPINIQYNKYYSESHHIPYYHLSRDFKKSFFRALMQNLLPYYLYCKSCNKDQVYKFRIAIIDALKKYFDFKGWNGFPASNKGLHNFIGKCISSAESNLLNIKVLDIERNQRSKTPKFHSFKNRNEIIAKSFFTYFYNDKPITIDIAPIQRQILAQFEQHKPIKAIKSYRDVPYNRSKNLKMLNVVLGEQLPTNALGQINDFIGDDKSTFVNIGGVNKGARKAITTRFHPKQKEILYGKRVLGLESTGSLKKPRTL